MTHSAEGGRRRGV